MKAHYKFIVFSILLVSCFAFIQPGLDEKISTAEVYKSKAISLDTLKTFFTQIDAGSNYSLALKNDSTVWTWGGNPVISQVEQVEGLRNVIAVSAGHQHSLALKSDGTVWAWGSSSRCCPNQVLYLKDIIAISASAQHSMALTKDSLVWTWGDQPLIGNATREFHYVPHIVKNLSGIIAISTGLSHYMVISKNGWVWAWGNNSSGQLGNALAKKHQYKNRIYKVNMLENVSSISAGTNFSLALKKDGTVWAWGRNRKGELGIGTFKDQEMPVQIGISQAKKRKVKGEKPAKTW